MKIRYKLSTIGILFLFLISFFSFFLGAENQRKLRITQNAEEYFGYTYSGEGAYFDENGLESVNTGEFKIDKGNVFFDGVLVFQNAAKCSYKSEIMYSVNEKIKYPLVKGRYTDRDTDNIILLGRQLKKYTYEIDGRDYLDVEGEPYRVVGYLGYKNIELYDYKMVFYADRIGDNLKEKIRSSCIQNFTFTVQSDQYTVDEMMQELNNKETLKDKLSSSEDMAIDGRTTTVMQENLYYIIVWLVCILNAVLVSELWITERMKEIRIRSAVGFSRIQILLRLYGELISSTAVFGGGILIVFLGVRFLAGTMEVYDILFACLVLFLSAVLFSAMVMIYPVYKLRKSNVMKIR